MFRSIKRAILKTKIADRWGRRRGELKGEAGAEYLRDNSQLEVNIMARVVRARGGRFQEMITPDFSFRGYQPQEETQKSSGLLGGFRRLFFGGH
jgi:hypothetical protein